MSQQRGSLIIVDDNQMNRDALSRRLERKGYTVHVAEDGQRALALIAQQPFDLVLLDIEMPVMSGLEVLQVLRATYAPTQLPIIMVTAKTQSTDIVEALRLGAVFLVTMVVVRTTMVVIHRRVALGEPIRSGMRIGISMLPTLVFTLIIAEILRERFGVSPAIFGGLVVYTLANTLIPGLALKLPPSDFEELRAPATSSPREVT